MHQTTQTLRYLALGHATFVMQKAALPQLDNLLQFFSVLFFSFPSIFLLEIYVMRDEAMT